MSKISFDERVINFIYTIQKHLLGNVVCSLIMLIVYPQSLTNADVFGQGNSNMVWESWKLLGVSSYQAVAHTCIRHCKLASPSVNKPYAHRRRACDSRNYRRVIVKIN